MGACYSSASNGTIHRRVVVQGRGPKRLGSPPDQQSPHTNCRSAPRDKPVLRFLGREAAPPKTAPASAVLPVGESLDARRHRSVPVLPVESPSFPHVVAPRRRRRRRRRRQRWRGRPFHSRGGGWHRGAWSHGDRVCRRTDGKLREQGREGGLAGASGADPPFIFEA